MVGLADVDVMDNGMAAEPPGTVLPVPSVRATDEDGNAALANGTSANDSTNTVNDLRDTATFGIGVILVLLVVLVQS